MPDSSETIVAGQYVVHADNVFVEAGPLFKGLIPVAPLLIAPVTTATRILPFLRNSSGGG